MNILIVEDEFITRAALKRSLTKMGYTICGEAPDAKTAIDILKNKIVDLAILDINIEGDKNGIWVADYIKTNYTIPYIFLTAHGDKSIVKEAMKSKPYGYLMKPFETVDVFTAIETSLVNFGYRKKDEETEDAIISKDSLFIKEDHLFTKINYTEILYIKSFGNYLEINTKDKRHVVRDTLKNYEEKLPKSTFFRSHKTSIINLSHLANVGPNFVIINNLEIPLSERIRPELLQKLDIS